MKAWLFDRPGRLGVTVLTVSLVALAATVVVLAIRVQSLGSDAPPRPPEQTYPPSAVIPVPTGDETGLATPAPPSATDSLTLPDQSYATVTEQAFPDAGDPTPIVLEAVNEWISWNFTGLEDNLLPGVLEEAVANPPVRDTKVDGVARVTTPGPTQSTVTVPTNKGDLLVTCLVVNGSWMVESMGWSAVP